MPWENIRSSRGSYINMIKAGEAGGILDVVIKRLVVFLETSINFKKEIVSALILPDPSYRRRRHGWSRCFISMSSEFLEDLFGHGAGASFDDHAPHQGEQPFRLIIGGSSLAVCWR